MAATAKKCNYPCPNRPKYADNEDEKPTPPYDKNLIPPDPCAPPVSAEPEGPPKYKSTYPEVCCPTCDCCKDKNLDKYCPPVSQVSSTPCPSHPQNAGSNFKPQEDSLDAEPYRPGQIADAHIDSKMTKSVPYADQSYCPCPPQDRSMPKSVQFSTTVTGCQHPPPNLSPQPGNNANNLLWPENPPKCKLADVTHCCPQEGNAIAAYQQPGMDDVRAPQPDKPPCYLPQPGDEMLAATTESKMGPIGPWATGRVDWGPLAGLTGTRPVVDKYSITRYSDGEWRQKNAEMLKATDGDIHYSTLVDFNGRRCIERVRAEADKNQADNTKRLQQRALDVHRWKCELERSIAALADEIDLLELQRTRLKNAASVLGLPEAIAGECMNIRCGRIDGELVRDEVEEELVKEVALIAEIRLLFAKTLSDAEMQMVENKTAKQRIETDWSDKKISNEIDNLNVALNNRSNIILFKPGATRFMDDQSSIEHWEHFTREILGEGETTRQRSAAFRATLDSILLNSARDLRTQADKVDLALANRIACTDEMRESQENKLRTVLQRLADIETIISDLEAMIRRLDCPMKVAQTRLDNRTQRMRVENCRDVPQFGLIDEVKSLGEQISAVRGQLQQSKAAQDALIKRRSELELDIMFKRKTLECDRTRCQALRTHYPSAAALSGTG